MMRNQMLRALALGLLCLCAPALAAAVKPAPAQSVSPRKDARARFVAYLDSEHHQSKLDTNGKQQLFFDLGATIGRHPTLATLAKLAPDAALLVEMKRLHTGTAQVELAERYGAKLVLVRRFGAGYSNLRKVHETDLALQVVDAAGKQLDTNAQGLAVFGITKPKHFKALLEKAMERLAPEDYTK